MKRTLIVPSILAAVTVIGLAGAAMQSRSALSTAAVTQPKPAANVAAAGFAQTGSTANTPPARATTQPALGAPVSATTGAAIAAPAPPVANQADTSAPIPDVQRMIVKNASLNIQVDDPESTLNQVDQLVASQQGVITTQTVRTQDQKTFVNLTIQVSPDQFESMLAKLRDLRAHGTSVLNDAVSSQDVTDQYIDLDAQYRNLQATRDAYQKLLDKATAVSDVITLTREVANIQTQMDQIRGRQNLLQKQSSVSTITLALTPVGAAPSPSPKPLPQPVQAAQQAWSALLTGLQGLAVVLIWMVILLPLPALALAGGWLIYRRMSRPAYQPDGSRN
ncbi:MAG: DUF4349 domain-containing protein [Chloroflexi bacterium]|nr:DUF4349 domain-containing protein [Chloroflexota bacterium]